VLKNSVSIYLLFLQGRVKFPTGGDSPRICNKIELVWFQYRQYSLDGRRKTIDRFD